MSEVMTSSSSLDSMPCSSMILAGILLSHSLQVQYLQGMPALTQAHLLFLHPFVQLHVYFSSKNEGAAAYSRVIGHRNPWVSVPSCNVVLFPSILIKIEVAP